MDLAPLQMFLYDSMAWGMLLWTAAYWLFSGVIYYAYRQGGRSVFGEHIKGTANFVAWCGTAHLFMFLVMLNHDISTWVTVGIDVVSLNVFVLGGIYSLYRAWRLFSHARLLAEVIRDLTSGNSQQ